MDKEHTVKWLKNAIEYHQQEQPQAPTRWIAEQHQEREKAIKAALSLVEAKA